VSKLSKIYGFRLFNGAVVCRNKDCLDRAAEGGSIKQVLTAGLAGGKHCGQCGTELLALIIPYRSVVIG
jgi:hypothetical protein